jgi:hypothetical protein
MRIGSETKMELIGLTGKSNSKSFYMNGLSEYDPDIKIALYHWKMLTRRELLAN